MKIGDKVLNKETGNAHFIALITDTQVAVRDGVYLLQDPHKFELIHECTEEEHVTFLEGMAGMSNQNDPRVRWAKFALEQLRDLPPEEPVVIP